MPFGTRLYIENQLINLTIFSSKENDFFSKIFLILKYLFVSSCSSQTTPIYFLSPKGTKTIEPGLSFPNLPEK